MTDLVQIKIPRSGKRCLVKDCDNHSGDGLFFGDLCAPCYAFLAGHRGGERSQAFRNAMSAASQVLLTRSTLLNAGRLLANYGSGVLSMSPGREDAD